MLAAQGLTFPLLENANEYIVHSFAYNDYLTEVDPPSSIGRVGASLDKAFASKPSASQQAAWIGDHTCDCMPPCTFGLQTAAHPASRSLG